MNITFNQDQSATIVFEQASSGTGTIHSISSEHYDRIVKIPSGELAVVLAAYYGQDCQMVGTDYAALYEYQKDNSCGIFLNNGKKIIECELRCVSFDDDEPAEFILTDLSTGREL
jgi:hypothetical protein